MQLEHTFTVLAGVDDAWAVLLDIERIAPCMPGAVIDTVDGDDFTGTVRVKLGPIGLTYKGKASFVERDVENHRAVIDARGRDARGNGTANAKITATLTEAGSATEVHVVTDLDITGKPAQFGRGVMVDIGNKLIGQFADCLAGKLGGGGGVVSAPQVEAVSSSAAGPTSPDTPAVSSAAPIAEPAAADQPAVPVPVAPARPSPGTVEPINLIESAGQAVAKRLAPVAIAVGLVLVLVRRRRRRPIIRPRR